jgi:hypothetical protein
MEPGGKLSVELKTSASVQASNLRLKVWDLTQGPSGALSALGWRDCKLSQALTSHVGWIPVGYYDFVITNRAGTKVLAHREGVELLAGASDEPLVISLD